MSDKLSCQIDKMYSVMDSGYQSSKTRSQTVIPVINFIKEKQRVIIAENELRNFLSIVNRSQRDFLSFVTAKTGTQCALIRGTGLKLRGDIPLETLERVKNEFIKSVECAVCNSIETTLVNGVKTCLACG